MAMPIIYAKKSCRDCKKALEYLENMGYQPEVRDIIMETPTRDFLQQHIDEDDVPEFLNPRSPIFRERDLGDHPPTKAEAIRYMRVDPNLIKRPILIHKDHVVFGFDGDLYDEIFNI